MKKYAVKSIFGPTLQGEGSLNGTVTVFVRLSGCNMWDGRPETRAASQCPYCDTDFFGGDKMEAHEIVDRIRQLAPPPTFVTLSGGEPLLQVDDNLCATIKMAGYRIAIETNGTVRLHPRMRPLVDHVTCSPKVEPSKMILSDCDDLKVLFPHPNPNISPEAFADFPAATRYLQPVNGDNELDLGSVAKCLEKIYQLNETRTHSEWKLSLQTHKILNID